MNPNNVAVPPPLQFGGFERNRANSAGYARLRAASEMRRQGLISEEEKAKIKDLLIKRDPAWIEQFDNAQQTGDYSTVKKLLQSHSWAQDNMLMDMHDLNIAEDDLLSYFQDSDFLSTVQPRIKVTPPHPATQQVMQHRSSLGFGSEFAVPPHIGSDSNLPAYTRKRQASRSMPAQGMNKVMASSQSAVAASPPHPSVGHTRRPSGPMDVHASLMFNRSGGSGQHIQQRSSHGLGSPLSQAHLQGSDRPGVKSEYRGERGAGSALLHGQNKTSQAVHNKLGTGLGLGAASRHGMDPGLDGDGDLGPEDETGRLAKSRKNERERKRRLAVTQGFDELYKLLQRMDGDSNDGRGRSEGLSTMMGTPKPDKASILKSSVERIQGLEQEIYHLNSENTRLKQLIDMTK